MKAVVLTTSVVVGVILVLGSCGALWTATDKAAKPGHFSRPKDSPVEVAIQEPFPPLPHQGESLGSTYKLLVSRTAKGDRAAAERLFNDFSECLRIDRLDAAFSRAVNDKTWILNNPDAFKGFGGDPKMNRERALDQIEDELDEIKNGRRLCAGAPKNIGDGRIYQIALAAARAGDEHAVACLLMAPYESPPINDQQGQTYSNEVMALARSAIENGSWNVALAMMYVYSGMPRNGYSQYVTFVDPQKELQYSELVRMGVPDGSPDAMHLDSRLKLLQETIPPDEKAAAMDWARQTYRDYFFARGPVFSDSLPCDH